MIPANLLIMDVRISVGISSGRHAGILITGAAAGVVTALFVESDALRDKAATCLAVGWA